MLRKRRKKILLAFTLIELLVAIAIFGVLSLLIAQFLVNFMNLKFNAETRQRIRQEGNYALDRIEFLIRNSITLPDLCCVLSSGGSSYIPMSTATPQQASIIKLNTQGTTVDHFFQRHRVALMKDELVLFSPNDSSYKHNDSNIWWTDYDKSISLTTARTGSAGTVPFKVTALNFSCHKDNFTNGYITKIEFKINYDRKTFNTSSPSIIENFSREVAVVNANPFEN